MPHQSSIRRIVPNIYTNDLEKCKQFYQAYLDMKLAMDLEWVLTFCSKDNPTAQISIFKSEADNPPDNSAIFLSIEVEDVDYMHQQAQKQNLPIVYPIKNEAWGVRRFFVKGPSGETINILSHKT